MNLKELQLLFEHNYWVRDKLLANLALVEADSLNERRPVSFGSVLGTMTHVLKAENVWRVRCQSGISPKTVKYVDALESIEALRQAWHVEEREMRGYLASLDAEQMGADVSYTSIRGGQFTNVLWHIFFQLLFHATTHYSEIAAFLTELGHSPGNLDFIIYIREQREA